MKKIIYLFLAIFSTNLYSKEPIIYIATDTKEIKIYHYDKNCKILKEKINSGYFLLDELKYKEALQKKYVLCNKDKCKGKSELLRLKQKKFETEREYYKKGQRYLEQSKNLIGTEKIELLKEAVKNYTEAIKLDSENIDYYYERAKAYHFLKAYEKAIQDYNKSLKIDPNDDKIYFELSSVFYDKKDYKKAVNLLNKAIELNENNPEYFNVISINYYLLNDFDKALENMEKVLELEANNKEYIKNAFYLYYKLEYYDSAYEQFKRLTDKDFESKREYLYYSIQTINSLCGYNNPDDPDLSLVLIEIDELLKIDNSSENLFIKAELLAKHSSVQKDQNKKKESYVISINIYDKLIQRKSNNFKYYKGKFNLLENNKKNAGYKYFHKLVKKNIDPLLKAEIYFFLGNNINDYKKAIQYYNLAAKNGYLEIIIDNQDDVKVFNNLIKIGLADKVKNYIDIVLESNNYKMEEYYLSLHYSITLDRFDIFKELIKYVNKFEQPGDWFDRFYVLHNTTFHDNDKIAKILIDKGYNVNQQEISFGQTPLHEASKNNAIKVAKLLIDKGAKKEIKDNDGKTPLDYASTIEMKKLLK